MDQENALSKCGKMLQKDTKPLYMSKIVLRYLGNKNLIGRRTNIISQIVFKIHLINLHYCTFSLTICY